MINRYDRNKTAKLLRQFAAGQITNDDLDDNLPRSEDSAVRAIVHGAWYLYDDM